MNKHLFTSERLGFRNWIESDESTMIEIKADPIVMEFFPNLPSARQTKDFIKRMQKQFLEKGFCYLPLTN